MFWENIIGSLKVGKYADMVVWDGDLLGVEPKKLLDLKVKGTMVDGKWICQD